MIYVGELRIVRENDYAMILNLSFKENSYSNSLEYIKIGNILIIRFQLYYAIVKGLPIKYIR